MLINSDTIIKLGEDNIVKAYLGESVVYENTSPTPTPYTELEYLQSTGTQYIETNYTPNSNTVIEFQISDITSPTQPQTPYALLYSASTEWDYNIYAMTYQNRHTYNGFRQMCPRGLSAFNNGQQANKNIIRVAQYGAKTYFNGIQYVDGTPTTPYHLTTLHILGENRYDDFGGQENYYKTYYFKIWENDILIYDFIPVLDSNNVPCLYDKVSQTFFHNAGTGDFLYGTLD